jgi:hypothetical protein
MVGSYWNSIFINFLRILHTDFHNKLTNLYFHQQGIRISFILNPPHQHLLLFVFLMIVFLIGVRWNFNIVLICISLMNENIENFFTYLLISCTFSFEKFLFSSCGHSLIRLFIILVLNFLTFYFK